MAAAGKAPIVRSGRDLRAMTFATTTNVPATVKKRHERTDANSRTQPLRSAARSSHRQPTARVARRDRLAAPYRKRNPDRYDKREVESR